ncbi:hypothetical protein MAPG_05978 [Magnaporthiopsis poae ATCC 64411]|uniref:Uncharacterized protein n=1 Tax=Magnaporthiopsis poae (strain ATCC 64411 / 73-15) TaxID=644358 RepID=A0A0C4E0U1_MAGP6|nr:hypothetical protein MAPG_05978 [Magnaporthiopsis poae ATCC 64411]
MRPSVLSRLRLLGSGGTRLGCKAAPCPRNWRPSTDEAGTLSQEHFPRHSRAVESAVIQTARWEAGSIPSLRKPHPSASVRLGSRSDTLFTWLLAHSIFIYAAKLRQRLGSLCTIFSRAVTRASGAIATAGAAARVPVVVPVILVAHWLVATLAMDLIRR